MRHCFFTLARRTRMAAGPKRSLAPIAVAAACLLSGCTTDRTTEPSRSATEEMLISAAADRAAADIDAQMLRGKTTYVDSSNFKGLDQEYTIASIRERLVELGAHLVDDKKTADTIVELRNGAQSIDQHSFLIGIPQLPIPIPLAGSINLPELALFKRAQDVGVAKLALLAYDNKTGALQTASGPHYGFAHVTHYTVLLVINWENNDSLPNDQKPIKSGD